MGQGRLGYELSLAVDRAWNKWTGLFDALPFWDPYLAVTSVFAAMLLAGYLIKWMFQDNG